MLSGASNMTSAGGASLRLLSAGARRPAPAAVTAPALPTSGPTTAIPASVATAQAAAAPAPAPVAAAPAVTTPAATPRLLSHQVPANVEQVLESVRADATSAMTQALAALNTATAQVLPAIAGLREQIQALTSAAPAAAPAPVAAPVPAPAPAPHAPKPAAKPKAQAAPKPARPTAPKKPTSAANFKDMLGISDARLAKVLGIPADSARKNLPVIAQAIKEEGITNKNAIIGILATIKTEVGNFEPIHEYGGPSYWARYNGRSDLGNRRGTNDGVTYHGRGYIQLTGRANYTTYGKELGVDLVNNPNKALDPKIAAKVLIQYFKNRGLIGEATQGDWMAVRKGVNGGTNGWDRFISTVNQLKKAVYK